MARTTRVPAELSSREQKVNGDENMKELVIAMMIVTGFCLVYYFLKNRMSGNYSSDSNSKFLCDSCAYDYDRACYNRERPNVKSCNQYKKRY